MDHWPVKAEYIFFTFCKLSILVIFTCGRDINLWKDWMLYFNNFHFTQKRCVIDVSILRRVSYNIWFVFYNNFALPVIKSTYIYCWRIYLYNIERPTLIKTYNWVHLHEQGTHPLAIYGAILLSLIAIRRFSGDYSANSCPVSHCRPCSADHGSCVGLSDGINVWPGREWSPFFLECADERTIISTRCSEPPAYIFSPDAQSCVDIFHVPKEHGGLQPSCAETEDGMYPDEVGRCPFYYKCFNNAFVDFYQCPDGENFDYRTSLCQHPVNVCAPCGAENWWVEHIHHYYQHWNLANFVQQSMNCVDILVSLHSKVK